MDSSRDLQIRYSAVEQYIRSLPYLPDAWDFNGETLTVVSDGDITTIPYENTQTIMAAEDVGGLGGRDLTPDIEDNEDFRYFSQADEKRDPLEERKDQSFFISVSLVPKDYFVTDMEQVQQDVQEFLGVSTRAGWQPDDHLIIAVDSDNNEIDILIHSFGDMIPYDRMVQLHNLFSEVFKNIDVSGYVYADFVEPLIEINYPLTYGYPAARQAMMARAWGAEDSSTLCKCEIPRPRHVGVHPITCQRCDQIIEEEFEAEGDEYVCCVCSRTRTMADGSDFPYWAHEVECDGPEVEDYCDCDLMICSARCDEEGLAKGDFHYPLESESFAADGSRSVVYIGPWFHGSFVDFIDADHFILIDSQPLTEGWGEKDLDEEYEEEYLAELVDRYSTLGFEVIGNKTGLNSEGSGLYQFRNSRGQTIDYYYNTVFPFSQGQKVQEVMDQIAVAKELIIAGFHPHEDLLDFMNPDVFYLYATTYFATNKRDWNRERDDDDLIIHLFNKEDVDFVVMDATDDDEGNMIDLGELARFSGRGSYRKAVKSMENSQWELGEAESFAAEGSTTWIELDPVLVARWLSTSHPDTPTEPAPIWSTEEAETLLHIMQAIDDGQLTGHGTAQDLLAIAARDGPETIVSIQFNTDIFDAETVVFEARPTTMNKIREKYVEIWEGTDYAEKDEDDDDYGLPHQIASTLREIDEKSEIKEQSLEWICNQFAATDPTTDELWDPKLIWPEDLPRAQAIWKWYSEAKKDPRIQNKFRELFPGRSPKNPLDYSVEDIEDVMDATTPESEKSAKNVRWNPQELGYDPKIAKEIHHKDGLMVVQITEGSGAAQAASTYASGTRWCTSSPSTATYYLKQGPIYIVFQNGQKFAQIHSETNQVCDIRDRNMSTLPEQLSQFMFTQTKKNYDEKQDLIKDPESVREYLARIHEEDLSERFAQESAKLKSLQTRFGDPGDSKDDPIRALIVQPYIDKDRMDEIKSSQQALLEQLEGDLSNLVSDTEVANWINSQERSLGNVLQSMIQYRESSEGVKPDDPEFREQMYEIIETKGPVDGFEISTYGGGKTFGKAYTYFMGDGKRNPKLEAVLLNPTHLVHPDALPIPNAIDTALHYYMTPALANEWDGEDRWRELEHTLDPHTTKSKLIKQFRKKNTHSHSVWGDTIQRYLTVETRNHNSRWEDNTEPDIWRWPEGLLMIMGKHDLSLPIVKDRRMRVKEILSTATERYKKGHQEQMPESLAKKVIPRLPPADILEYSEIFPEHLIQGITLPVIEKSITIQEIAQELIKLVYSRGNFSANSHLDAWPEGEERVIEYIQSGGELTPEIVTAFETVIEPKLDPVLRTIRESNITGGMKPPAQKGYPCERCLQNISWNSDLDAWVDPAGDVTCVSVSGYGAGVELENHSLMIPSALLNCDKCKGWRPVAKIQKDRLSWKEKRFISDVGRIGPAIKDDQVEFSGGKCKCTFRKDNINLYEAEDIYSAEGRQNKCGNCGELGHTRRTCTNETKEDPVDPRKIDDFEPTVPKESKMARGARIKRNIKKLLMKCGPLTRAALAAAYQAQSTARSKPRQDMNLLTRMANADRELIWWSDRYYLLGPGGKQEFFMSGPGSLGLSEKKSAEEHVGKWFTVTFSIDWMDDEVSMEDAKSPTDLADDPLEQLMDDLSDRGIYFDTGGGDEGFDWELDWSLEGATPEQILAILDERSIPYSIRNIREPETFTAEGSTPAPFGEIDAAMADALART